jgi:hypothetical protein
MRVSIDSHQAFAEDKTGVVSVYDSPRSWGLKEAD